MTPDLAALRALSEAATPGPWEVLDSDQGSPHGLEWTVYAPAAETEDYTGWVGQPDDGDCGVIDCGIGGKRDAALIAAARNALPDLLNLVESQATKIETLEHELDGQVWRQSNQAAEIGRLSALSDSLEDQTVEQAAALHQHRALVADLLSVAVPITDSETGEVYWQLAEVSLSIVPNLLTRHGFAATSEAGE